MTESKRNKLPQEADDGTSNIPSRVQGEGDYDAARRHRSSVEDFLESNNPEQLARAAAPTNAQEARELEEAEQRGREGPDDAAVSGHEPRDRAAPKSQR
jgi:hypothetical protein